MRSYTINALAIVYAIGLLALFEFGLMNKSDAFFAASALIVTYTVVQLVSREGTPLFQAIKAIATDPSDYPRPTAYLAYLVAVGLGIFVMSHSLIA